MFDIKSAYINIFTTLAELRRAGESQDLVEIYECVLRVIENDPRFKAMGFVELSQPGEK